MKKSFHGTSTCIREYNPLQLMMKQTLVRTTLEEYPLAEYSLKRVSPLTKFKPNYSTAHPLQNLLTSHTPSHTFHVAPPQFRSEIRVQELFSNLVTARHGEDDEKERNKSCWHGPIESAYSTVCFWHTAFESSARLSHKVLWAGQVPPQFNTHTHIYKQSNGGHTGSVGYIARETTDKGQEDEKKVRRFYFQLLENIYSLIQHWSTTEKSISGGNSSGRIEKVSCDDGANLLGRIVRREG